MTDVSFVNREKIGMIKSLLPINGGVLDRTGRSSFLAEGITEKFFDAYVRLSIKISNGNVTGSAYKGNVNK